MGKSKVILTALCILLAVFLLYQGYAVFYNPITTEIVNITEAVDGIDITGVIIRKEELIKSEKSAAMHYEIKDNERVAANGVIANIYGDISQSVAAAELQEVENKIKHIEEIHKYNDLNAVDLGTLNAKIYGAFNEIAISTSTGNFSQISGWREDMLTLMNRRKIATGQEEDYSVYLAELKAKRESLLSAVGQPADVLRAEKSGYFVSVTDGYEKVLTPEKLEEITPEFLENIRPEEQLEQNTVGKLVSDYTWYIAAEVSINDSLNFKTGDKLTINTALKSNPELSVMVHMINMSTNRDSAVIIFSCQEMSGELSSMRSGNMTVVKKKYSGFSVNSKALRVVNKKVESPDGTITEKPVTGVYVVNGFTANFVPVNIVYTFDGRAICEKIQEEGNLKLYDEIIVKGKNIYDGKIVE